MAKQKNPHGLGSYRKKNDGRWEWRQTKDGAERSLTSRSLKELQQKVKEIADLPIIKSKFTVDEWFQKYLSNISGLRKAATYNQYESIYRIHIKPVIGKMVISKVTSSDIQEVIVKMNKAGKSTKTMKHAHTVMSVGFAKALKDKHISENPVLDIEIPNKQNKGKKVLSFTEIVKLYKVMEKSRWLWAVKFLLSTGVRRGELLALRWSDVDYENMRIKIDESNSVTGVGDTKSAKIHYVPLSKKVLNILEGQYNQLVKEENKVTMDNLVYIDCRKTDSLIFPGLKGEAVKPNSFYHTVQRFGDKAEIHVHPHCFRHTFVFLSAKTLSLKELQNALGHDESTTTLDIYGDLIEETNKAAADKLDNVFDSVEENIQKAKEKLEQEEEENKKKVKKLGKKAK